MGAMDKFRCWTLSINTLGHTEVRKPLGRSILDYLDTEMIKSGIACDSRSQ